MDIQVLLPGGPKKPVKKIIDAQNGTPRKMIEDKWVRGVISPLLLGVMGPTHNWFLGPPSKAIL